MNQRERALQNEIRAKLPVCTQYFRNATIIDNNPVPVRDKAGSVCGIKKTHANKGAGDLLIQAPGGRAFWLECKTGNRKQTKEQKNFQAKWEAGGGKYYVVRSVRDALMACLDFAGAHGVVDHLLERVLEQVL